MREPRPGWVEQEPEELVASLHAVIARVFVALGARAGQIVSAGLATQRASMVCWDRHTGEALSPIISWQDRRAHEWLDQFSAQTQAVHQRTGLRLSSHYGAAKMRWCLDHLPAVAGARREGRLAMGPLASFLLFRLLEEKPLLADPANAARTLLWNLRALDWDPWLLALFGIPAETLPRGVPTRHAFGTLRGRVGYAMGANGWVLLDVVSLGYELWRQFNGFPPVLAPALTPMLELIAELTTRLAAYAAAVLHLVRAT